MRNLIPFQVSLSKETEKAIINRRTATTSHQDVDNWAFQTPPNDVTKRKKVQAWMRRNPTRVDRVREQLRGWAYYEKRAVSVESLTECGATDDTAATEQ